MEVALRGRDPLAEVLGHRQVNEKIRAQLAKASLLPYVSDAEDKGHGVVGFVNLAVLPLLRSDPRFAEGVFYGLHQDVGHHLTDFRSYNGALGSGSLQLVIDQATGRFWADIDKHNPYQDVVRFMGHAFVEVVPGWLRKLFGRKT